MSVSDFYLGRQPILNRKHTIVAYELLFRSSEQNAAVILDDMHATSNVIVNAFTEMDIGSVLAGKQGFINIGAELLMSDIVELLPKKMVVLELLETIEITPAVVERCRALRQQGFTLALDDVLAWSAAYEPLLQGIVSIIKFDLLQVPVEKLPDALAPFKHYPIKLLAEKVDNHEQAKQCLDLGFEYFQGYHYARPQVLSSKKANPDKLALLKLLGLLIADAETSAIDTVFRVNPNLTYSLLRLVNSAACGLPTPIHAVHQAIVILGRQQLLRWLQLLLFANHDDQSGYPSPLMQLAANRGRLMELLSRSLPGINPDEAFMTGILSLLDTLMGMTLPEILQQLNLDKKVQQALLQQQGTLGALLKLTTLLDTSNFDGIDALLPELAPLTVAQITQAQLDAAQWVTQLSSSSH